MGKKYTIGLDFGTLSMRGVLVDCADGKIISKCSKSYTHGIITELDGLSLEEGAALQDPMDYIEAINHVIPEIILGIDPDSIIGIGVDFTSCTMLPMDLYGIPLCIYDQYKNRKNAYVKLWKHHSAQKYADLINRYIESNGMQNDILFGGKVSSELMIPKVMETKAEDPEIYEAAYAFVEAGDYITFQLTNSLKHSSSFAGYKNFYNGEDYLPDEFYELLGLKKIKKKFPATIKNPGENLRDAGLCDKWATALGLKPGIHVSAGIIDSHAALPASGIVDSSKVMLILGTSSVLIGLSDHPFGGHGIVGHMKDTAVPDYYVLESGVAAVGDLFEWFVNNQVPSVYVEEADEKGMDIYSLLNEKARKIYQTDLLVLDYWNGNKTPYVNSKLKGAIANYTLNTKCEEIYLALIEATAFSAKQILNYYQEQIPEIQELVASGTIARKNPFVMQIYADVLELPISLVNSNDGAAVGSAIYGAIASEQYNYREAVSQMSHVLEKVYMPDSSKKEYYTKKYQQYLKLSEIFVKQGGISAL